MAPATHSPNADAHSVLPIAGPRVTLIGMVLLVALALSGCGEGAAGFGSSLRGRSGRTHGSPTRPGRATGSSPTSGTAATPSASWSSPTLRVTPGWSPPRRCRLSTSCQFSAMTERSAIGAWSTQFVAPTDSSRSSWSCEGHRANRGARTSIWWPSPGGAAYDRTIGRCDDCR